MKVLVCRADGMLGQDVSRVARLANHELVALTHAEPDVADRAAVEAAVREHEPRAVVHCAAHTNVDGAEEAAELDCRVLSWTTEEAGRPAPRPALSALETQWADAIRLPDWREGLGAYLPARAVGT